VKNETNDNRMKVMTILGTRPEIIRLSACLRENDRVFKHTLVHTGQNYDYTLNEIFFEDLGLRAPDYYLECAGAHLGETIGNIISRSYEIMLKIKPEALLILGDTNSALAAISAKRLKIPIFHMEAGNRCWDWNVPEMINRKIVDHISDVNLPYTEHARRYLLSEGMDGKFIFVTGSPMHEVILQSKEKIDASDILERLALEKKKYIVVSAHREENIDNGKNFFELMSAINSIAERYGYPVIFSTHPRTMNQIKDNNFVFHSLVRNIKPLGFLDYVRLQQCSYFVLSDSGTLSEESAILNFPAILIRTSTERPEVLDKGTILIGGITERDILQAIEMALYASMHENILANDYIDVNVSRKVVMAIQSYAKIVNIATWQKT